MPTIGLTGNFGMGKTTVLRLFGQLGSYTFNVDEFVHDILKKPEIIKKISNILGEKILTKSTVNISINKKNVADIIFSEPQRRRALEEIIHPEVLKAMKRTESEILNKNPSATIIFEVPLLFEAGYENEFDKVIVVYCNRNSAVIRLEKKGFSKNEAWKRINTQISITRKKKMADFVINNNDDIQKTKLQVKRIFKKISI